MDGLRIGRVDLTTQVSFPFVFFGCSMYIDFLQLAALPNFLRVPLCCQVQWQEAMTFLCQFLHNRTNAPGTIACTICIDDQPLNQGSQRSRTPVHHLLQPVVEEVVSSPVWCWVWCWVWLVVVERRGRWGELHAWNLEGGA